MNRKYAFAWAVCSLLAVLLAAVGPVHAGLVLTGGGLMLVEEGGIFDMGNLASPVAGSSPFAIDQYGGSHQTQYLNDLNYGNTRSWIGLTNSPTLGEGFAGITLAGPRVVDSIAFGRANIGSYPDRWQGLYTLQYTTVASPDQTTPDSAWVDIGTLDYQSAGGTNFTNPTLRHRYGFAPVTATGVRLIVPEVYNDKANGTDGATCIDEIELYYSPMVTYERNMEGSSAWNFTSIPGPISGDLADSATVNVEGAEHSSSGGGVGALTDGVGGSGTTGQSFFHADHVDTGKIQMSWANPQLVGEVRTFSFQNFDPNDRRFDQEYKLYGSTVASPGITDGDLAGPDWILLADVNSITGPDPDWPFGSVGATDSKLHPEQIAVSIKNDGGAVLGSFRHLLWRIEPGADATSEYHAFWSEFDALPTELTLTETGGTFGVRNVAAASAGGLAFAKDCISGYAAHAIDHLNDETYGNDNSWIGSTDPSFAGVALGGPHMIHAIAFGRSNAGSHDDRYQGTYTLQYTLVDDPDESTADSLWATIANLTYTSTQPDSTGWLRHLYNFAPIDGVTGVRILVDGSSPSNTNICFDELEVYAVPEPGSLALLLGAMGLAIAASRRFRRHS